MNEFQGLVGKSIHRRLIGTQGDDDFDYIISDVVIDDDGVFTLICRCDEKHKKKWKFKFSERDILDLIYKGCCTNMIRKDILGYGTIYSRDTVDLLCGKKLHTIETFSIL